MDGFKEIITFIRKLYGTEEFIPLHVPFFLGNEKTYLNECIDTGFVSSVGEFVNRFEEMIKEITGAKYAVAAVNGTAAIHAALHLLETGPGDLVLTQPLTFVATANAVAYCGAEPVFIDVSEETLGMDPEKLRLWLQENVEIGEEGRAFHKRRKKTITACLPVHVFGHPLEIEKIVSVCSDYNIPVLEDAAESLGSSYQGKQTGTFGRMGVFSFNGNKTVTTGGGGVIVTDDDDLGPKAKYITTTAKKPHAYEYYHDMLGFNYRMPNVNAALGCAQLEMLDAFIGEKRHIAESYKGFFADLNGGIRFFAEPDNARSNYWLNALVFPGRTERDAFLEYSNGSNVMTRPVWKLMPKLPMYKHCEKGDLPTAERLEERIVNIPSSIRPGEIKRTGGAGAGRE